MRKLFAAFAASILVGMLAISCRQQSDDYSPEKIIALERTAFDRWGNGDPKGYLELYAPDVTYFDPSREKRVDGLEAMTQIFDPITGKVKIDGAWKIIHSHWSFTTPVLKNPPPPL